MKNIIKNFKTPKPFIASIIIACILVSYNIPIFITTSSNSFCGDACTLIVLTILTSLVVYLLSINKLLVRIITIPLVLISSSFLYFILFYKIKIYPPIMTAIFETETTEALELISTNLVLWVLVFGAIPAYLIIKLTKNIDRSNKPKFYFWIIIIFISVLLNFNIWNTYSTIKSFKASFKIRFPKSYACLKPSDAFNKYMPYSYIYNTKIYFSKITNYITQKKKYLTAEYLFNLSNKKNKNSFFVLVLGLLYQNQLIGSLL